MPGLHMHGRGEPHDPPFVGRAMFSYRLCRFVATLQTNPILLCRSSGIISSVGYVVSLDAARSPNTMVIWSAAILYGTVTQHVWWVIAQHRRREHDTCSRTGLLGLFGSYPSFDGYS